MEYIPDNWVVLKITDGNNIFYKVLAGWSGGYLYGDSWRMNSGVTKVDELEDSFVFHGKSGSKYVCIKGRYGLRHNTAGIHAQLVENFKDKIETMDESSNWVDLIQKDHL